LSHSQHANATLAEDGSGVSVEADMRLNRLLDLILEAGVNALLFDAATVSACVDGVLSTVAATDRRLEALDDAQYAGQRGPCVEALERGGAIVVVDAAADERWPLSRETADYLGIHTTLALHLPIPEDAGLSGALNLYSRRRFDVTAEQCRMASSFAKQMAVTMQSVQSNRVAARLAEQMAEAMQSRAVIEQAKGMLMAERGVSDDEAFQLLVRLSQRANVKLRTVAARLVAERSSVAPQEVG
jgi:hypothetical protein